MFTSDDLNYDSLGVTGSTTPDITPNLDRLAAEGMLFSRAHVAVAVCQPSRSALMTGRYPHHNGALGFSPIWDEVPTLTEHLNNAGYLNGIFGKARHLEPQTKFQWDSVELQNSRSPLRLLQDMSQFLGRANDEGKPFFYMANTSDPHPPYTGNESWPRRSRIYTPNEVAVPGFLPDLPEVRAEVARYYTEVHTVDEFVAAGLRTLDDFDLADNTIVLFMSDHGMAFPFAKANVYTASTRTPLLVRWPGVVEPGSVDDEHFVSAVDVMPTILAALDLAPMKPVDGRSMLPILQGGQQAGRDSVFTVLHQTRSGRKLSMRAVQNHRFAYVYNEWSDGRMSFKSSSMNSATFAAMTTAAETDPAMAQRVRFLRYRVPEELYDLENDPHQLTNLAGDPSYQAELRTMRRQLLKHMQRNGDPLTTAYMDVIRPATMEAPTVVSAGLANDVAPHRIQLTFSHDVELSLSADDLHVHNQTTGASVASSDFTLTYQSDTNTATWSASASMARVMPDGHYEVVLSGNDVWDGFGIVLDGDNDRTAGGDFRFRFDQLQADLDGDGKVGDPDLNTLLANLGTAGDLTRQNGDLTGDGAVTDADLAAMLSRLGTTATAANAAAIATAAPTPPFLGQVAHITARRPPARLGTFDRQTVTAIDLPGPRPRLIDTAGFGAALLGPAWYLRAHVEPHPGPSLRAYGGRTFLNAP